MNTNSIFFIILLSVTFHFLLDNREVCAQDFDCSNPALMLKKIPKDEVLKTEIALLPARDTRVELKSSEFDDFMDNIEPLDRLLFEALSSGIKGLSIKKIQSYRDFEQDYQMSVDVEQYRVIKTSGGTYIGRCILQIQITDGYIQEQETEKISIETIWGKKIKKDKLAKYEEILHASIRQKLIDFIKDWQIRAAYPFKIETVLAEAPLEDGNIERAKKVAIITGLQQAVRNAWGSEIESLTLVKDFGLESFEIKDKTKGLIRRFKSFYELPCRDKGIFYIALQAKIVNPNNAK